MRAPVIPDMEADQGEHEFTYALYLFQGPFTGSNVVREAYELNTEVLVSGSILHIHTSFTAGGRDKTQVTAPPIHS